MGTAHMVPLQTWSLAIPLTLFLVTLKTYQPNHMPTPLHRAGDAQLVLGQYPHISGCPNTDQKRSL